MSSDNGSWIYFVIMVVLSIIGSISKSKDKKAQKPMLPTDEESEASFPEIFFPEKAKPQKQTEFVPSVSGLKPREFFEEGTSAMSVGALQKSDVVPSFDTDVPPVELNFEREGEIRKAIIYSEIFNRKYF